MGQKVNKPRKCSFIMASCSEGWIVWRHKQADTSKTVGTEPQSGNRFESAAVSSFWSPRSPLRTMFTQLMQRKQKDGSRGAGENDNLASSWSNWNSKGWFSIMTLQCWALIHSYHGGRLLTWSHKSNYFKRFPHQSSSSNKFQIQRNTEWMNGRMDDWWFE